MIEPRSWFPAPDPGESTGNPTRQALRADIADRLRITGGPGPARKNQGAVYTPWDLAAFVVDRALFFRKEGPGAPGTGHRLPRVLDPACGSGHFLVAAWSGIRGRWRGGPAPVECLAGIDIDPVAIARCAEVLALCSRLDEIELGCSPAVPALRVGDALLDGLDGPWARADLVVGNPPYVRVDRLAPDYRQRLLARFGGVLQGKWDLYLCFLATWERWLAPGGILAFVTPNQYLLGTSAAKLRPELSQRLRIRLLLDCCGLPSFAGAIPPAAISIFENVVPRPGDRIQAGVCLPGREARVPPLLCDAAWGEVRQDAWREGLWSVFAPDPFTTWLGGLEAPTLGDLCDKIAEGDTQRREEALILPAERAPSDWLPAIRGRNIAAGDLTPTPDRLPPPASDASRASRRVLIRDVAARLVAAAERAPVRCLRTVYCAYPHDPTLCEPIAALLNTDLLTWIFLRLFYSSKMSPQAANFRFQAQFLRHLPVLFPADPRHLERPGDHVVEAYRVPEPYRAEIPALLTRLGALSG